MFLRVRKNSENKPEKTTENASNRQKATETARKSTSDANEPKTTKKIFGGRKSTLNKQKTTKKDVKREKKKKIPAFFKASLRSCVTLEVVGFNQTKLLSEFGEHGITLLGVTKSAQNRMRIRLEKKHSEKSFAILDRMCYTYCVVSYDGIIPYAFCHLNRIGIAIGTLVCAACMFLLSGIVTKVEISDMDNIGKQELTAYLAEAGYGVGSRIDDIDRDEIRRVVNAYDGVAECSVEIRGTTLGITVLERDVTSLGRKPKAQIVSRYDATVTQVVTGSGTARVGIGQIVKAGDVLIEGAVYGTDGEKLSDVGAEGTVYGVTVKNYSYVAGLDSYAYVRTGRSEKRTKLNFFGLCLGKNEPPYESYESETGKGKLNAFIPIGVESTVYYETELKRETRSIDELAEEYKQKALSEFSGSARRLDAATHTVEIAAGLYQINVYVEAEIIISD